MPSSRSHSSEVYFLNKVLRQLVTKAGRERLPNVKLCKHKDVSHGLKTSISHKNLIQVTAA